MEETGQVLGVAVTEQKYNALRIEISNLANKDGYDKHFDYRNFTDWGN